MPDVGNIFYVSYIATLVAAVMHSGVGYSQCFYYISIFKSNLVYYEALKIWLFEFAA